MHTIYIFTQIILLGDDVIEPCEDLYHVHNEQGAFVCILTEGCVQGI